MNGKANKSDIQLGVLSSRTKIFEAIVLSLAEQASFPCSSADQQSRKEVGDFTGNAEDHQVNILRTRLSIPL
jgi:hypothetical protein